MIKNNFRCSLSTPVYTNRQVLELGKLVTIVIHDQDDGSWKFFSREEKMNSGESVVLVSLADILMIDPSLGDIAHLPEGSLATRKGLGDSWSFSSYRMSPKNNNVKKETLKT